MNLIQIHAGEDYSWLEWMGRGANAFRLDGRRVKIIRTFKEQHGGNKKATGYCEVFLLDDEGEFKFDSAGQYVTRKVRAADIFGMWDEYADERDRQQQIINKQQEECRRRREEREREWREAEERRKVEREERERIERERREKLEAEKREKNKIIYEWLEQKGIKENGDGKVRIYITDQYVQVTIRRDS
jgi:hypothetical protein